ncbi:cyclase family protein [Streptomyces poonensis]|uniref:Cyclase n=1 Tax=Streptomyces poonensis TaxID=68255 RepID=A0A918UMH6_9ACTN|nr:cyclase family protein [Streptomyces poonensis]GGZ21226.1 cyclase [Streptomyces poonensis]
MRVIDISQGWYEGMPSFGASWYPQFSLERAMSPQTDPAGVDRTFSTLHLFPHNGSHVESRFHFYPDGEKIDEVPLETFTGRACVADLSHKKDLEPVEADDLAGALQDVWTPGDRLLIRTGHPERHLGQDDYWDVAPFLTPSAAEWIVDNRAALVGMDCVTEEPGDRRFPVHRRVLGASIPLLENLAGLHRVSERVTWLFALPVKVSDSEAAPVRAVVVEGLLPMIDGQRDA